MFDTGVCVNIPDVVATDDAAVAFKDIDAAFLVGAMPRKEGMERKDLLAANVKIFKVQVWWWCCVIHSFTGRVSGHTSPCILIFFSFLSASIMYNNYAWKDTPVSSPWQQLQQKWAHWA